MLLHSWITFQKLHLHYTKLLPGWAFSCWSTRWHSCKEFSTREDCGSGVVVLNKQSKTKNYKCSENSKEQMNKSKCPKHLKYNCVKCRLLELSEYVYIIWILSNVLSFSAIELYHHGSVLNIFMNHQLCHLSKHLWVEK